MRAGHWRAITEAAATQRGLVTAAQLRLSGATTSEIGDALADGRLHRVRHRVVAMAGTPPDPWRAPRAVSLVLPEGVVSHRSAAVLHGMMRAWAGPVEVTVAPGRLPRLTGAVPHQSVVLTEDRTEVDGIRVTSAARTIVDLAAALEPAWLERLLHEAVMRRQCAYADVAAVIDRTGGRGRPGTEDLRRMLGESVGDSALEVRWHRLLVKAGLRPPARQHQLVVDGRVYLLDFAWPDAQVALEVDGFAAHRTRAAFDRDRAKVLALQSAGWEVLSVSARTAPDLVIALLRRSISPFHRDSACGNAG